MTKAFKHVSRLALFGALCIAASSCSDETYTLPAANINPDQLVEGVAFSVEHDAQNPNIVYLKSLMPAEYSVAWITPQGRRAQNEVTLQIPFDGEYEIQMGVDTRGGYVWSNPYKFTIDDFCADFVEHYLWTRICGGVGNSKTWQLDLGVLDDGSVKTTFWTGPHWFFTNTYTWDNLHSAVENENVNDNYVDSGMDWNPSSAIAPTDEWKWEADYAGNSWMCAANNYGYITFDLIGGANVTVTDAAGNVVGKGTYMLDTEAHTLSLSDVYPLETTDSRTHERFLQVLYLSDNALQLMAPSEGVSLNYVTQDYFENYSPSVPTEISLPETWAQDLATQNNYCTWRLNDRAPFDWYDLGGEKKNGFSGISDYPGNVTPVDATVTEFRLDFNNPATGKYVATLPDGGSVNGDYSVINNGTNGYISLSGGIGSSDLGGSSVKLEGDELTVISVGYDDLGRMSNLVLGVPQKDVNGTVYEYLGYQFIADYGAEQKVSYRASLQYFNTGWAFTTQDIYIENPGTYTFTIPMTESDPYGIFLDVYKILDDYPNCDVYLNEIKVDGNDTGMTDADVTRDVGDETNTARRYILNPWNDASAAWTDKFKVNESFSVTITVTFDNGKPFVPSAEE